MSRFLTVISAVVLLPGAALAHHGQDFFLLEDYELPAPGHGQILSAFDWERRGSRDTFGAEPGVFLSLWPRTGFSLNAEFSDAGGSWRGQSVTPRLHFQLTPPAADFPLHISLSVARHLYDGALGGERYTETIVTSEAAPVETRTVTTTVTPPAPEVEEPPCDPAVDIDCVPAAPRRTPRHSGHVATPQSVTIVRTQPAAGRSVERRTVRERTGPAVPDEWEARIVLQSDIGPLRAVANAVAVLPDGGDLLWAYAAGVRWQFHPALAAGVEAAGEFTADGEHELITGLTWTPTHHLSLRGGVGIGLSATAPDISVHTGVVWRF